MNLQAREIQSRRTARNSSARRKSGGFGFLAAIVHVLVLGCILFFVVNYRISLKDDIARLNREATTLKRNIHQYDRELEHLKLKREALTSWTHIRSKIREYNLALVAPEPYQVRQVMIDRKRNISSSEASVTSPLVVSQTTQGRSDLQ